MIGIIDGASEYVLGSTTAEIVETYERMRDGGQLPREGIGQMHEGGVIHGNPVDPRTMRPFDVSSSRLPPPIDGINDRYEAAVTLAEQHGNCTVVIRCGHVRAATRYVRDVFGYVIEGAALGCSHAAGTPPHSSDLVRGTKLLMITCNAEQVHNTAQDWTIIDAINPQIVVREYTPPEDRSTRVEPETHHRETRSTTAGTWSLAITDITHNQNQPHTTLHVRCGYTNQVAEHARAAGWTLGEGDGCTLSGAHRPHTITLTGENRTLVITCEPVPEQEAAICGHTWRPDNSCSVHSEYHVCTYGEVHTGMHTCACGAEQQERPTPFDVIAGEPLRGVGTFIDDGMPEEDVAKLAVRRTVATLTGTQQGFVRVPPRMAAAACEALPGDWNVASRHDGWRKLERSGTGTRICIYFKEADPVLLDGYDLVVTVDGHKFDYRSTRVVSRHQCHVCGNPNEHECACPSCRSEWPCTDTTHVCHGEDGHYCDRTNEHSGLCRCSCGTVRPPAVMDTQR